MSDRSRRICRELAAKRAELQESLDEIRELLDDIADADADDSWCRPAVPVADIPRRMEQLARKIRRLFDLEEDERYLTALSRRRPELRNRFEELNAEHSELLELVEQLYELAGSSVRPASTWDDIELHYLGFERRLANHRQGEEELLALAGLSEI